MRLIVRLKGRPLRIVLPIKEGTLIGKADDKSSPFLIIILTIERSAKTYRILLKCY
jgi:hypothetical protein